VISTSVREQVEGQDSLGALAPCHHDERRLEDRVSLVQSAIIGSGPDWISLALSFLHGKDPASIGPIFALKDHLNSVE